MASSYVAQSGGTLNGLRRPITWFYDSPGWKGAFELLQMSCACPRGLVIAFSLALPLGRARSPPGPSGVWRRWCGGRVGLPGAGLPRAWTGLPHHTETAVPWLRQPTVTLGRLLCLFGPRPSSLTWEWGSCSSACTVLSTAPAWRSGGPRVQVLLLTLAAPVSRVLGVSQAVGARPRVGWGLWQGAGFSH